MIPRRTILFALSFFLDTAVAHASEPESLARVCERQLSSIPGANKVDDLRSTCAQVRQLGTCASRDGVPIFHLDRTGENGGRRILAMSLIHGDEGPSGTVTRQWASRLLTIAPRNHWRVIPVVNPDGFRLKKRTNANGVDINRNFPSKEWDDTALESWRVKTKSDPRRYPGPKGGSETETQCVLQHIEDFRPDFVISIHTPIGVLDFDGPPVKVPTLSPLPWAPLGNFPGSLGRYMWKDRNVPVLTIELKGNAGVTKLEELDRLQDISGNLAIEAMKRSAREQSGP